MNTGAPFPSVDVAQRRVLHFQRKLHEWASADAERRFCDLWNLVCDPATLVVAWSRVSQNRGSRTAGVDSDTRRHIEARGVEQFLTELREELRSGSFRPLPVRERLIPKRDGRKRRLGIPNPQGQSGTDGPQARHGTDLRIGFLSVELRLPARTPGAGRNRRDLPVRDPLLRVDRQDGHRGVLRSACNIRAPA